MQGDRRGVVVQFVERHVELADHVDDELREQRRAIGVEESIEAASHAIVFEGAPGRLGQAEQRRNAGLGPLGKGVERHASQGEVAHEHAERLTRRDAGAGMRPRQMLIEQGVEAEALEQAVDQGEPPDLLTVELEGGGGQHGGPSSNPRV